MDRARACSVINERSQEMALLATSDRRAATKETNRYPVPLAINVPRADIKDLNQEAIITPDTGGTRACMP